MEERKRDIRPRREGRDEAPGRRTTAGRERAEEERKTAENGTKPSPGRGRGKEERRQNFDASITLPRAVWASELTKERPKEISSFLESALRVHWVDELVLFLSTEQGVKKLNAILSSPLSLTGSTGRERTFQSIGLNFLRLCTGEKLLSSSHASAVRTIYRVIYYHPLFLESFIHTLKTEKKHLKRLGLLSPSLSLLSSLLSALCTKVPGAASDPEIRRCAEELTSWIITENLTGDAEEKSLQTLRATLRVCQQLGQREEREESSGTHPASSSDYRLRSTNGSLSLLSSLRLARPSHPSGPRHDNDPEDFRRIQIVPTQEEILSLEEPFLPQVGEVRPREEGLEAEDEEEELEEKFRLHLDRHFRLLREDFLAPYRRAIQWLLGPGPIYERLQGSKQSTRERKEENIPRLFVLSGVQLQGVKADLRCGILLSFSCRQPPAVQQMSKAKERRQYWENSKMLQPGALVAIAVGVPSFFVSSSPSKERANEEGGADGNANSFPRFREVGAELILFAVVAEGDVNSAIRRSHDPKELVVHLKVFLPSSQILTLGKRMETEGGYPPRQQTQNLLVQASSVFFPGYDPVLRSLQAHGEERDGVPKDIQRIICAMAGEEIWTTPPAYLLQSQPPRAYDIIRTPAPLSHSITFNLEHLVAEGRHSAMDLRKVAVQDYPRLKELLHYEEAQGNLLLDGSQVEAFCAALTHQCCLIQGPPGTGKSYVGTIIVRTILRQRSLVETSSHSSSASGRRAPRVVPILCVCYTNHALDQFLEGLVEAGIEKEKIIRMGGRSKSSLLEERNLTFLMRGGKGGGRSREESRALKAQFARYRELEDGLKDYAESLSLSPSSNFQQFQKWMKEFYPEQLENITGTEDEDGFQLVGKGGKQFTAFQRWQSWISGKSEVPVYRPLRKEMNGTELSTASPVLSSSSRSSSASSLLDLDSAALSREQEQTEAAPGEDVDLEELEDSETLLSIGERIGDSLETTEGEAESLLQLNFCTMWLLSPEQRLAVASYLNERFMQHRTEQFQRIVAECEEVVQRRRELEDAEKLRLLRSSHIVGVTTTGCAKYRELLTSLRPSIVICEEAGEVLEAQILSSISPGLKQLIMIGDHLQLRPKVEEYSLSAVSGRGYGLDISLFERLVCERTAHYMKESEGQRGRDPRDIMNEKGILVTLKTQRRMRPEIADLVRLTLYEDLKDSAGVRDYPPLKGFTSSLYFLDHQHKEKESGGISKQNDFEARMVVELVEYLLRQGCYGTEDKTIAVLTPYLGQLVLIRRYLLERRIAMSVEEKDEEMIKEEEEDEERESSPQFTPSLSSTPLIQVRSLHSCVHLSTVDNFQGNEAAVILLSTVRCNAEGRVGFLKMSNRVNVMLSRAREGMIVLGSTSTIRQSRGATMLHAVLELLEDRNMLGSALQLRCQLHGRENSVSSPEDFRVKVPDGGCLLPCRARLPCGHVCPRACHVDDASHNAASLRCLEPCAKVLPCGHPCTERCCQPCVCRKLVKNVPLPCGHVLQSVACNELHRQDGRLPLCHHPVTISLPLCGHNVQVPCHELQSARKDGDAEGTMKISWLRKKSYSCSHPCGAVRADCSHPCSLRCGLCLVANLSDAEEAFAKALKEARERVTEGSNILEWNEHGGPCQQPCNRALLCGHLCTASPCHKAGQCPPCPLPCPNACPHSACQKLCKAPCPSCAEPCPWSCTHQGQCPLPCGSPCIRLPCDQRCERRLQGCGHQCPGLCGEDCPASEYCPSCGPRAAKGDEVVDLILLTALKDHDPSDSPLIRLPCGHIFTVETLDGCVGIESLYVRAESPSGGEREACWVAALPLSHSTSFGASPPACPHCRQPIYGVRRYGRAINYAVLQSAEKKFQGETSRAILQLQTQRRTVQRVLETLSDTKGQRAKRKRWESRWDRLLRIENMARKQVQMKTPTEEVLEKEISRLSQLFTTTDSTATKDLNLSTYRQTFQHKPMIDSRLELLSIQELLFRLYVAQDWNTEGGAVSPDVEQEYKGREHRKGGSSRGHTDRERESHFVETYENGVKTEKRLLELCEESRSGSSQCKALILGIHFRASYIQALTSVPCKSRERREESNEEGREAELSNEKIREELSETMERHFEKLTSLCSSEVLSSYGRELPRLRRLIDLSRGVPFYSEISAEERLQIWQAMETEGLSEHMYGGFGWHWYQCPNGHPYYIGECGGANEARACPECGAGIGGGSHRVAEGNTSARAFFQPALQGS